MHMTYILYYRTEKLELSQGTGQIHLYPFPDRFRRDRSTRILRHVLFTCDLRIRTLLLHTYQTGHAAVASHPHQLQVSAQSLHNLCAAPYRCLRRICAGLSGWNQQMAHV